MHIDQLIARERTARARRYALEDAARHALRQTLATYSANGQPWPSAGARRRFDAAWDHAMDDSLRCFGEEATGRALLSLGRAAPMRATKA